MIGYVLIASAIKFVSNEQQSTDTLNVSFDYYGTKDTDKIQVVHDSLTPDQAALRFKYLVASILVKAATWVKAPYLFALYNRLHKFTRADIGLLYCLDNIASLIFGPIIGSLCDLLGRKKFCVLYSFLVISHIGLRLTGDRTLAIFAQIITGISGVILDTSFESWLNFESSLLFSNDEEGKRAKNSFLREVFSKQIQVDCFSSIALTGVATVLYMNYGIFYPFYLCIVFSGLAGIYMAIRWNENNIQLLRYTEESELHKSGFFEKIKYSYNTLIQDKPLIAVGIIESCFKISLTLFSFMWTPLLEETVLKRVSPGAVFICFMLARLVGSEVFQGSKKVLKTNTYLLSIIITLTGSISFWFDYSFNSFNIRLIMLIYFDGLSGIFMPLMSSLKSQMIPEKERTTIMNFFRIPINVFCLFILFANEYMTTFQLCLIAFGFMTIATVVNLLLISWHTPPDAEKRVVLTTTVMKKSSKHINQILSSKDVLKNIRQKGEKYFYELEDDFK